MQSTNASSATPKDYVPLEFSVTFICSYLVKKEKNTLPLPELKKQSVILGGRILAEAQTTRNYSIVELIFGDTCRNKKSKKKKTLPVLEERDNTYKIIEEFIKQIHTEYTKESGDSMKPSKLEVESLFEKVAAIIDRLIKARKQLIAEKEEEKKCMMKQKAADADLMMQELLAEEEAAKQGNKKKKNKKKKKGKSVQSGAKAAAQASAAQAKTAAAQAEKAAAQAETAAAQAEVVAAQVSAEQRPKSYAEAARVGLYATDHSQNGPQPANAAAAPSRATK